MNVEKFMHEIRNKLKIKHTVLANPGSPSRFWNDSGLGLPI